MVPVQRGEEPDSLKTARERELPKLAALGRPPISEEITGYQIVGEALWRAQHYKCCYCEMKIAKSYNDVEHYRPKARALCAPGAKRDYGYWWLAWTWANLLFSCPRCNRSKKRDHFPLASGSVSLADYQAPPGAELPLLLDPSNTVNPLDHIVFKWEAVGRGQPKHWRARPRDGSQLGNYSIDVYDLNDEELLDLRDDYYENHIKYPISKLQAALANGNTAVIVERYDEALLLLRETQQYVALAYDALCSAIDNAQLLNTIGRKWPDRAELPIHSTP